MFGKLFVIFLLSCINIDSISAETSNFVCYHGTWSKYRYGNGAFNVGNIDTSHCTHLVYSFIGLRTTGSVYSLDDWLDNGLNNLKAFTALKSARRDLKALVAVGGWSDSTNFPYVAASATLRAVFIKSLLEFVQTYNFDGIDFDWEYPAQRGGTPQDVQNFVTLLKEFRAVFEPLGLLITAAVSASAPSVAASYDVPAFSQYVDMINVMTYDLRGAWDGVTGHNAPLYASSKDLTAEDLQLNVDACITNWIAQGAPPAKINLGIPLYGRTFTLASTADVSVGAPVSDAGIAGPYTQEAGYLGYTEIVEKINEGGWTYVWDDEQQVPHIYKGDQWIGYDDPRAVAVKVKYAQSKGLGGVMVWSIETDDHLALSGTKNPLLSAITNQLAAGSSSDSATTVSTPTTTISTTPAATKSTKTTTPATTTSTETTTPATTKSTKTTRSSETTTTSTTSTTVADENQSTVTICKAVGYVKHSSDCSKFYRCTKNDDGTFTTTTYTCSAGLYFDSAISNCNWKNKVNC